MKTLFGERKSVKALAFLLALALVLPLMPVMAVVAESTTIESVVFKNALDSSVGVSDADAYFYSANGNIDLSTVSEGSENEAWDTARKQMVDLKKDGQRDVKITFHTGVAARFKQSIKFTIDREYYGTTGPDCEIQLSYNEGNSLKKVILVPDSEGYYSIEANGAHKSDDGNYTVEAIIPAKKYNVRINDTTSGRVYLEEANWGDNTVTAEESGKAKISFTLENFDETQSLVVEENGSGTWKPVSGTPEEDVTRYTINNIDKDIVVRVRLQAIKYTVTVIGGTGSGFVANIPDSVDYTGRLRFTIETIEGYTAPTVKYKIGEKDSEHNVTSLADGKTYEINEINDNVTITITNGTQITHIVNTSAGDGYNANVNGTVYHATTFSITVTPKQGYRVTAVTFIGDSGTTISANKTDVNEWKVPGGVTENGSISVTVELVQVTLTFTNGGDFTPKTVNVKTDSLFDSSSGKIQADGLKTLLGRPNRYGLKPKGTGAFTYNDDFVIGTGTDQTLDITVNWEIDPQTFFVLTTTPSYDSAQKSLIFTSTLGPSDRVDAAAVAEYWKPDQVRIEYYGIFYGQYSSTLTNDAETFNKAKECVAKQITAEQQNLQVQTDLGNKVSGEVYFYGYQAQGFASSSSYTHRFNKMSGNVGRSAIAWYQLTIDGQKDPVIIVGNAVSFTTPADSAN